MKQTLSDQLDLAVLGGTLLNVVMSSGHLGHSDVKLTIRDYLREEVNENLEITFIRDVFTKDTDYVMTKWFGGSEEVGFKLLRNIGL